MTKTCTKCGKTKPLSDFALHKHRRDGHHSSCKVCHRSRGQHKDWAFQEQRLMEETKPLQDFYTTYRVNGGECECP